MKAVVLDGMPAVESTAPASHALQATLSTRGWAVKTYPLARIDIRPCIGCFRCWTDRPGECDLEGVHREISREVIQSNLMVLLTPITFGGYSSNLKKALDHLIPNVAPFFRQVHGETHHVMRYKQYPRLMVVGVQASCDPESEQIFRFLAERNRRNFEPPAWAVGVLSAELGPESQQWALSELLDQVEVQT